MTKEQREAVERERARLTGEISAKNPGREFAVLFGDIGGGKPGFAAIWTDGKGELAC